MKAQKFSLETTNLHKVSLSDIGVVVSGVAILSLLAQISVPLPHTPVPITGQTLGISLVSLSLGRAKAFSSVSLYLFLGFMGLPIFSHGASGFGVGPTSGYLAGMLLDSYVMGSLADRKWTSKFMTTWLAIVIGSNVTFACGLLVLASYIPTSQLLQAGLWPFLPGDFVKTLVATGLIGLRSRSGNPT